MTSSETGLPRLNEDYPVSEAARQAYQEKGHALLRGVCSPAEVAAFRPAIAELVAKRKAALPPLAERDTYGKAFLQCTNLWDESDVVAHFSLARRLAKIAAELMGVKGARIYHDQALFKEAGGGHTPWHQDQHYWPLATDNTITMWMPLVPVTRDMGIMTFASGSHTEGYLGDLPISDTSEAKFRAFVDEKGYELASCDAMAPGDATFHTGWTLHSAPGNRSDRTREVMTIIWYENGARIMVPDNQNRENDLRVWFPGQAPGEVAASRLNPLLYAEME